MLPFQNFRTVLFHRAATTHDLQIFASGFYGGNVVEDILVIEEESRTFTNPEHLQSWKRLFFTMYGFHFSTIRARMSPTTCPKIIEILNIHADCIVLDRWQDDNRADVRSQVLCVCNSLICQWLFRCPDDFLEQNSESLENYKRLKGVYHLR